MSEISKAAFLGTGLMGFPMARNLSAAGVTLSAWNRSAEKAIGLSRFGVHVASSAAEAVKNADIIISMVSDGPTVALILDDAALQKALKPDAVWVDMSSTKPEEARAQAAHLRALNIRHLDAPVSGGTKGAEAGSLAIMVGGAADDFSQVQDVLAGLGRPTHVGPSGAGQLAKLANQAIVAVTIGVVAEAMLLLERGGADPAAVRAALQGGFADSVILQQHGERMTTGNFVPGGPAKFHLKDLNNGLNEAAQLGVTLPVTQHIRDRFKHLVEHMGGADTDHSGLYLELLEHGKNKP